MLKCGSKRLKIECMAKELKIDYYDHMCYCTIYECVDGSQGFIQGGGNQGFLPPPPKNLEKNPVRNPGSLETIPGTAGDTDGAVFYHVHGGWL